jgi:hypothetical protein
VAGLAADAGNSATTSNIIVIVSFFLNFDMGDSFFSDTGFGLQLKFNWKTSKITGYFRQPDG